jgi:hypothetical protein
MAGLPEEVIHVVGAHTLAREGQFVRASLECSIIQYADHAFWEILRHAGMIDTGG